MRRILIASVVVAAAIVLAVAASAGARSTARGAAATPNAAQIWMVQALTPDERAQALLAQMTLPEKIDLVTGDLNFNYGFFNAAIPRLMIPALKMADGPPGVRIANQTVNGGRATALPAPIALAATWDPELAHRYGDVIGDEAFNTDHNVHLGPSVDIARVPFGARTFEGLGEDPLLQSRIVAPYIRGVQSHSVMSTVKHYNLNNQEAFRAFVNVAIADRPLQEIYTPAWEAATKVGDAASVMCAFNKVNGTYACENRALLTDILKQQLGFPGFVLTDFGANKSTVESANAGLDQEQPGNAPPGSPFQGQWGPKLQAAVEAGPVSMATLDDKVLRILRQMFAKGLFDNPVRIVPFDERGHGVTARQIAASGMVLLENEGGVLPLAGHLGSIAVIGPDADNASAAGGGSGLIKPTYTVSPLEGIRARAGAGVQVEYAPGTDAIGWGDLLPGPPAVPSSLLSPAGGGPGATGLKAEYWSNKDFAGSPALVRTEPQVNLLNGFFNFPGFNASSPKIPPMPQNIGGRENACMSARFTGSFTAPSTGQYTLALTHMGSARLVFDGNVLIDSPGEFVETNSTTVNLVSGQPHTLLIEYRTDSQVQECRRHGAHIRFAWTPPADAISPLMRQAIDLAKRSDVAVVVTRTYESEAFYFDRNNLELPNNQDQLVREIAKANPHTVVVMMSGTPNKVKNWIDAVPAVVQAWYAGQEQGNALADVLFGDVNPSGKLPLTFPIDEQQTPFTTQAQYPAGDLDACIVLAASGGGGSGPGSGGSVPDSGGSPLLAAADQPHCTVNYSEGLFVGYRGYDQFDIEPQFPFGFGLSYTTFSYDHLQVTPATNDGSMHVLVRFRLTNTGQRAGAEVAQVYFGLPAGVGEPPKRLAAFARVRLDAGESKEVEIAISPNDVPRPLAYWDEARNGWATAKGEYKVYVGRSSRDLPLTRSFRVE
jgi:beta-glucosidase